MKHYIGIDLGTTNSSICSFDGQNVRIWKSPEQNDVTPSAILVDKRGNRYYGSKAYQQAFSSPQNAAVLFKRFMGTTEKIPIASAGLEMTPEECSAEILKVLFGYLPEDIRMSDDVATVITVPAAFNQVKKDATLRAAEMAGIGRVALMQEPVAAVMSVMRASKQEGIFLVYDLGGGTFDISIAENIGGKVNLLTHGGIEMCGGRDIDRMLFNKIVAPWLKQNFALPDDFLINPSYRTLCRTAQWAAERAKIELSSANSTVIALSESELRVLDMKGQEIYVNIPIERSHIDALLDGMIGETVAATREALKKAGINANDVEKIVFVGGPTNYKPLRDKVSFELAVAANLDVNPMTAVSEGASIFAESIDWDSLHHNRKASSAQMRANVGISFKYSARTSDREGHVVCVIDNEAQEYVVEFVSLDTGWSSGRSRLENNKAHSLPLESDGANRFRVDVYDALGRKVSLAENAITIVRTLATVGAIPASHAIGLEVVERLGGTPMLAFLVNEGDPLPKTGKITVKAGFTLKAGTAQTLNFKLWEGSIQFPVSDNRFIGTLEISGTDFEQGVIPVGADILCEYEMSDSGAINLEVSIPCIGATFHGRNFYSPLEGLEDLDNIDHIAEDGRALAERIDEVRKKVPDEQLDRAYEKARRAAALDACASGDHEDVQKANNDLLDAKKDFSESRMRNLKPIRQMELDDFIHYFSNFVEKYATESEKASFQALSATAQRSIDRSDADFDQLLQSMRVKMTQILARQDWFVISVFRNMAAAPHNFLDKPRFQLLKKQGEACIERDDIPGLRNVIGQLAQIQISRSDSAQMLDAANIVRG